MSRRPGVKTKLAALALGSVCQIPFARRRIHAP